MKKNVFGALMLFLAILSANSVKAGTYSLPAPQNALVGQIQYSPSVYNENVVDITKRYDIGYNQITNANPQIDPGRGFPSGVVLKIPTEFILPPLNRQGIVINLSEMRLYYFIPGSNIVKTYPVGIGKVGKMIPITRTFVAKKIVNPIWTPTPDIRAYNREQGIILPAYIPPGPDNPLGPYAIYLGIPEYRIHSTIFPESIGKRASFGCIRMIEADIKDFFPLVTAKTPVVIVDIPTKVGWQDNRLFLEAHPPLSERPAEIATYEGMVRLIQQSTQNQPTLVDWQLVDYIAKSHDGVPHEVGVRIR
jgi:L,D-transpeptidase ErfK/SrfK